MGKAEKVEQAVEVGNEFPIPANEYAQIVSEAEAEALKAQYLEFKVTTKSHYDTAKEAVKKVKKLRTAIEDRRVELKQPALEYGKLVDAEAKKFTAFLLPVETHLSAEIKAADDVEAARLKMVQDSRIKELLAAGFKFDGIRYVATTLTVRLDHLTDMAQDAFDKILSEGSEEIRKAREEQERKDKEAADARAAAEAAIKAQKAAEEQMRKMQEQLAEQQKMIDLQKSIINPTQAPAYIPGVPNEPLRMANTMRTIPIAPPAPPVFNMPPAPKPIHPLQWIIARIEENTTPVMIGETADIYSVQFYLNPVEWAKFQEAKKSI